MYLFGIQIPLLELLVVFSIVVVIYLIVLEFEFRQQKKITKEFDDEEARLSHEVRELRDTIDELKEAARMMKGKEEVEA